MKIKSLSVLTIIILLSIVTIVLIRKVTQKQQILPFKTEIPLRKDLVQYINASGTLKAKKLISVGSLVAGRVIALKADDTDVVEKDQVLAILDNGIGDNEVQQLCAELAIAQAEYTYQSQFYKRQKALFTAGQLSKNLFDLYTQNHAMAHAKVKRIKASLQIAKNTYDNLFIKAPEAGIITARNVELGQQITAQLQATVLFEIAENLESMEAWIDVDEADIGLVKDGQDALFSVDAFPKTKFTATVSRIRYQAKIIDNVVTYATVLDVRNPALTLRPGMTTNVDIKVAQATQVLVIPNKSLRINANNIESAASALQLNFEKIHNTHPTTNGQQQEKNAGKHSKQLQESLWIYENNTIKQIPVELGITDGRSTEVIKGITPTTQVIVEVEDIKRENPLLKGIFGNPGGLGK